MAYYHKTDDGKIVWMRLPKPWVVKCAKCGKVWPSSVLFKYSLPHDMTKFIVEKKEPSYAKWGDKIPFVNVVASKLPSWPRWARISVTCILVVSIVLLTMYLRGC